MSAEQTLTDRLLEAGMAPALIEQWLVILRPQLDTAGKYRRSTGTSIATGEVARLVMEAVAREAVQNAPQPPTPLPDFLRQPPRAFDR